MGVINGMGCKEEMCMCSRDMICSFLFLGRKEEVRDEAFVGWEEGFFFLLQQPTVAEVCLDDNVTDCSHDELDL